MNTGQIILANDGLAPPCCMVVHKFMFVFVHELYQNNTGLKSIKNHVNNRNIV
jgi:hypothetical protein